MGLIRAENDLKKTPPDGLSRFFREQSDQKFSDQTAQRVHIPLDLRMAQVQSCLIPRSDCRVIYFAPFHTEA